MTQEEYSDKADVIVYEEKPISEVTVQAEEIRVLEESKYINWKECCLKYWRFLAVTTAFAAIFLLIAILLEPDIAAPPSTVVESDYTSEENITVAVTPESDFAYEEKNENLSSIPATIIDESLVGFAIDDSMIDGYSLSPLIGVSKGVKIIVLHSHTSEYVSQSLSVLSVGEALTQILNSAGINSYHCRTDHDNDSALGSYGRMNDTLTELKQEYPDTVLVIDIHDSESGTPLSLTVGTGFDYGWMENLNLASAIISHTSDVERTIRLLPAELGQNNGVLTLNIGICGRDYSDEDARRVLASVANALIAICKNDTPSQSREGVSSFVRLIQLGSW